MHHRKQASPKKRLLERKVEKKAPEKLAKEEEHEFVLFMQVKFDDRAEKVNVIFGKIAS